MRLNVCNAYRIRQKELKREKKTYYVFLSLILLLGIVLEINGDRQIAFRFTAYSLSWCIKSDEIHRHKLLYSRADEQSHSQTVKRGPSVMSLSVIQSNHGQHDIQLGNLFLGRIE